MKCPKCQFDNREGAKFCLECGEKFEQKCPECKKSLPLNAKFCDECGYSIAQPSKAAPKELSFDEKLAKIQKYLPGGLSEKILSQRGKIEGERKQVTVMFADMEGFTPLVEKLGPEEAYSIMDQVYEILIHKVHDYEGTVNEMTGDGIMALFGAPIALEDAPQRAIRSAYAIHREMTRFNHKIMEEKEDIPLLRMRIGINTGPVVVGTLGNDLRVEFKVVGDTVNMASRMEDSAEPGATYVTEETFKLSEGLFRFESIGEKVIKGKEEPVKIYRVIGPSTSQTRFDVSAERGLTPFVGRERELELLLDGLERAKQGRGQAFSIVAEAGIGKSRLLYEFRKSVTNEDITFLEGKCLSYSRGVAYHPIIDLYKSNFDIRDTDTEYQIKDKIKKGLKQLDEDETSSLPFIFDLLSIKNKDTDEILMSREVRKERMIETLIRIPLKGSEIRPLVLAIEDLHWVDKGSEEVLKYILESIPGARIFLIFTYRPEFVHTWGGRSYHNQVTLNRLSNRESLTMVSHILDGKEIDPPLEDMILEKTDGVPFYIEEFLKSLIDLKVIELRNGRYDLSRDIKELSIPSTIQDVIMARVDSLPEGDKEVLQTGAVIEREFSYELIKQVTNFPEQELLSRLSSLKDSELIYERGIYPKSTYIFKHALTREVVYDSILNNKRKKLHNNIGQTILEIVKHNAEPYFEILAEHFTRGDNFEQGAKFWNLSARKAGRSDLSLEAISNSQRSLKCLDQLPESKSVQKEKVKLNIAMAQYYLNLNYHLEAKEIIDSVIDYVHEFNYKWYYPFINIVLGAYYIYVKEDLKQAIKYLEKAITLAGEVENFHSQAGATYFLGNALNSKGDFKQALIEYEKAFEIIKPHNIRPLMSTIKSTITLTLCWLGQIDLALETGKEAIELANDCDQRTKGMAGTAIGYAKFGKGEIRDAESYFLNAINLCEKSGQTSWAYIASGLLSCLYADVNDFEKSLMFYSKAIHFWKNTKLNTSLVNRFKEMLDPLKRLIQDNEIKTNSFNYAFDEVTYWHNLVFTVSVIGKFLITYDDKNSDQTENWILKTMETNKKAQFRFHFARDHVLCSGFYKKKGDQQKAKVYLNRAIEIFKECSADGWVEKYEKELAELS